MKFFVLCVILFITTNLYPQNGNLWTDGEIWFCFADNESSNYYVKATRHNQNEPLFGVNFMEVGTNIYDIVYSYDNPNNTLPPSGFNVLRGFNYLRDPGYFPSIGEGIIEFKIYRNDLLIYTFIVNLIHSYQSPDLTFKYFFTSNSLLCEGNNNGTPVTSILNNHSYNCWDLLGEARNITRYINQVTLTNLIAGTVENNIKTTFNSAPMGFPNNNVQLGVQYNPGTTVSLWRGVYYNITASHTSYVKNGVNYNFRNWGDPYTNSYSSNSIFKIQGNTLELRSMYFQTQPLTVLNNLEGGSTNNNFNIIWQTPTPDITTSWQFGSAFNLFNYSQNSDEYSIEAPSTFQNLNTTWWFNKWNDGSTNRLKQNLQVTSPTNLTAYYKGHFRSNSTSGISSNSQHKLCRTDNGIYHLVYESMGNVYYTHSLTSNFEGSWSQEELLMPNAKNPAIEYHSNKIKIVFEFYDAEYSTDAILYLITYEPNLSGAYVQVTNECEEVAHIPLSYFSNAKPVISYNQVQLFIAYRKNATEGLKERTKWYNNPNNIWIWGNENPIPETNLYSINPAVIGDFAHIHIVYENQGAIMYKYAVTRSFIGPWEYDAVKNLSSNSGYNTNNYPSISISEGSIPYVMVSWLGNYIAVLDKKLIKENEFSMDVHAAVTKVGYRNTWGDFNSFSNNVSYSSSGSLNSTSGSVLAWSESNGQFAKYVKRNSDGYFNQIGSLSSNGIQPLVSNGSDFSNIESIVFNTNSTAPHFLNKCTNNFAQNNLEKIGETETISISYGRSGIVEKSGIQFVYNIGNVINNGNAVQFISRVDTIPILNTEQLNSFARTEQFYLDAQSELIFSNYYYVVNGTLADSLLSDELNVNFKCEMVNALTDKVLGVFDNITYDKFNVMKYDNPCYLIDCSGIEQGNYYLRLNTTVNDSVNYSLSNIQRDDISLEKLKLNVKNFKGEVIPITYDLGQNFPNPFNPITTIRFQIPQDGIVTLIVYDILGAEVATLVNEQKVAGEYEVNFNASSLATGVYIYKLKVNGFVSTKKMVLIK